jgi:hypothetical protein
MEIYELAHVIYKQEHIDPLAAAAWAYRVLREYPNDLREAFLAWVSGNHNIPQIGIGNETLNGIMTSCKCTLPYAIEALNIVSKNEKDGREIIVRNIRR